MITSPTGKGVILIGGLRKKLTRSANEERMNPEIHSNELIELSGDSLDSCVQGAPFIEQLILS